MIEQIFRIFAEVLYIMMITEVLGQMILIDRINQNLTFHNVSSTLTLIDKLIEMRSDTNQLRRLRVCHTKYVDVMSAMERAFY